MIKKDYFAAKRGISAESADIPVVICDMFGTIIFKNKSAYSYKFPRLGSSLLKYIDKDGRDILTRDAHGENDGVFLSLSSDLCGFTKCFVTAKEEDHSDLIFFFSAAFSSLDQSDADDQSDSDKDFIKFLGKLARKMVYSSERLVIDSFSEAVGHVRLNMPRSVIALERRCFRSALESCRHTSSGKISVDNLYYVTNEYFKRIFKQSARLCGNLSYRFINDFPCSSLNYVDSPELFISSLLGVCTRLVIENDARSLEVTFKHRDKELVVDAIIKLEGSKAVNRALKKYCHTSEMLIINRLAKACGWRVDIRPAFVGECILFKVRSDLYTPSYVLNSRVFEFTHEEAMAWFTSFLDFSDGKSYGKSYTKSGGKPDSKSDRHEQFL